ncbi:acyl CoA:acetate/3-ketoacid CoA transferase [Oceanobacillus saliphilus]|uniref:acyl CoA:acetate/3-ketoacid CoA transferase n=1 Tax=Oceanobacillus saliphilus TaxID=2925834 RepID=UPI00201E5CD3|nr:malonate decarboxylase subunit alpha [Oceanobacillus saliphilus]
MAKVISAAEAAKLIKDEDFVATTTNGLGGLPEDLLASIETRYQEEGHPKSITFAHSCGIGNGQEGRGSDHLAYEGLVKRLIAGHTGTSPKMAKFAAEGKIEAYLLPQGVMTHMYRSTASKKPGVMTKVGLHTYVDPRVQGAKVNDNTTEELIKVVEFDGEEYLHYPNLPIDVAMIRATTADTAGNITIEGETVHFEQLPLATAAKNNGGIVIVQVKQIAEAGSLRPKDVTVPGSLVDYIVVNETPEYHSQTMGSVYNEAFTGDLRVPLDSIPPIKLDPRKVIARRAAMELVPDSLVNLGIGMPAGVSSVASEEGVGNEMTLTIELGVFGGTPAAGLDFGAAYNAGSMIPHDSMFDFYDGGGLDTAFLGAAQFDKFGNVNVSQFGSKVTGPGGFINISQSSKKIVFMGTLTVGGKAEIKDNKLVITEQGKAKKAVEEVQQITFSGKFANETNLPVLFVTERAVFDIHEGRLRLIEIAPGVDLEKDILEWMDFEPVIADDLKEMDPAIFAEQWGGLKEIIESKKSN